MTLERIAGIGFCFVLASAVAAAQQKSETGVQAPTRSVLERTHTASNISPGRRVQIRSESGGREVVVETSEAPDFEGRLAPIQETVVETVRTPNSSQRRREVFGYADGRRRLLETTETVTETLANGDTSIVHNTWAQDVNGRPGLTSRQIERTRSTASEVHRTETTLLVADAGGTLRESERTEYMERRIEPGVTRFDSSHLVRDINGRWQQVETRSGEARAGRTSERAEEETIQRRDFNGNTVVHERVFTHRSAANGQDREVIEVYAPPADRMPRSDSRLVLNQRVQRTTTATTGGRQTIEEVEGRHSVAPNEPLRVIRRTVTIVRQAGGSRSVAEREVFEPDANGRMRLVLY